MSQRTVIRLTIELDEGQMLHYGLSALIDGIGVDSEGNVTLPPVGVSSWLTPHRTIGTWERVVRNEPGE